MKFHWHHRNTNITFHCHRCYELMKLSSADKNRLTIEEVKFLCLGIPLNQFYFSFIGNDHLKTNFQKFSADEYQMKLN